MCESCCDDDSGDDIIGYCPGNIFVWVDCRLCGALIPLSAGGAGADNSNPTSAESRALSLLLQIQTK